MSVDEKTDAAWFVDLFETDGGDGKLAKTLGPFPSERLAERCEAGLNTNLNHERFWTETNQRVSA